MNDEPSARCPQCGNDAAPVVGDWFACLPCDILFDALDSEMSQPESAEESRQQFFDVQQQLRVDFRKLAAMLPPFVTFQFGTNDLSVDRMTQPEDGVALADQTVTESGEVSYYDQRWSLMLTTVTMGATKSSAEFGIGVIMASFEDMTCFELPDDRTYHEIHVLMETFGFRLGYMLQPNSPLLITSVTWSFPLSAGPRWFARYLRNYAEVHAIVGEKLVGADAGNSGVS